MEDDGKIVPFSNTGFIYAWILKVWRLLFCRGSAPVNYMPPQQWHHGAASCVQWSLKILLIYRMLMLCIDLRLSLYFCKNEQRFGINKAVLALKIPAWNNIKNKNVTLLYVKSKIQFIFSICSCVVFVCLPFCLFRSYHTCHEAFSSICGPVLPRRGKTYCILHSCYGVKRAVRAESDRYLPVAAKWLDEGE